jgi:seryl-tRNA synthetase
MRVQVNWALMFCAANGFTPVLTPDVVQSEVACDV